MTRLFKVRIKHFVLRNFSTSFYKLLRYEIIVQFSWKMDSTIDKKKCASSCSVKDNLKVCKNTLSVHNLKINKSLLITKM